MNDKIKTAFDSIHADDILKEKTAGFVRKACLKKNSSQKPRRRAAVYAICAACIVLLTLGYFSYTVPVAAVSIDINPSVELQINIYDKVIGIKGYNDDGCKLAEKLSLENREYTYAINQILNSDEIKALTESGGLTEITVTGKSASDIQNKILQKTDIPSDSVYCINRPEDVETAHAEGISFGKYRAYLELIQKNPDITIDDIRNLTMREIRQLAEDTASDQSGTETTESPSGSEDTGNNQSGGNGNQNSNAHRYGK